MLTGEIDHLRDLGFRHLVGEYTAYAHTLLVDMKHDARGFFARLVEKRSST